MGLARCVRAFQYTVSIHRRERIFNTASVSHFTRRIISITRSRNAIIAFHNLANHAPRIYIYSLLTIVKINSA